MFKKFFPQKKYEKPPYLDKIETIGKLQIVRAKGNMDQDMVPIIEERIQYNRSRGDAINYNILLDFAKVEKVDSAAIAFHLFRIKEYQENNFTIAFINIPEKYKSMVEMFKIDHEFVIYESEEQAIKDLS